MNRECFVCEREISFYDNVATTERKGVTVYLCRDCLEALNTMYEIEHTYAPNIFSGVEEPFKIIKKREHPIAIPSVESQIKYEVTEQILKDIYKIDFKKDVIDAVLKVRK